MRFPHEDGKKLADEDCKRFYKLFFTLLDYVNDKTKANPNVRNIAKAKSIDPYDVQTVVNVLWERPDLIDGFLKDSLSLSERDLELVSSWKRCVIGNFILDRILKKGAILISVETKEVYQVSGIISTWGEMFGLARLPVVFKTALMPFEGVIITNSLLLTSNLIIGRNMAKAFREIYLNAKNTGMVHTKL